MKPSQSMKFELDYLSGKKFPYKEFDEENIIQAFRKLKTIGCYAFILLGVEPKSGTNGVITGTWSLAKVMDVINALEWEAQVLRESLVKLQDKMDKP